MCPLVFTKKDFKILILSLFLLIANQMFYQNFAHHWIFETLLMPCLNSKQTFPYFKSSLLVVTNSFELMLFIFVNY
jgi:hypothetical protein